MTKHGHGRRRGQRRKAAQRHHDNEVVNVAAAASVVGTAGTALSPKVRVMALSFDALRFVHDVAGGALVQVFVAANTADAVGHGIAFSQKAKLNTKCNATAAVTFICDLLDGSRDRAMLYLVNGNNCVVVVVIVELIGTIAVASDYFACWR